MAKVAGVDWSSTSLRVLRAVAEHGSFTAAAAALGYTQSAVSRQMATLEHAVGEQLFDRGASGVQLTPAGRILLRGASTALDELDRTQHAIATKGSNEPVVRLGMFFSAGPILIPETITLLRQRAPQVHVVTREGPTPSLTKSLRASTLDLAVIGSRPPHPAPDNEDPPLNLETLLDGEMAVAVPATSDAGRAGTVTLAELATMPWVESPEGAEPSFGVWPALPQRPKITHRARDWLTKLTLVAHGLAVTTVPPHLAGLAPAGVRLVRVTDGAQVTRRASLARLPGQPSPEVQAVIDCVLEAAAQLATI